MILVGVPSSLFSLFLLLSTLLFVPRMSDHVTDVRVSPPLSLLPDVNECEVYRLDQGGKLCVYECVNIPGSYHCSCPSHYKLLPDGRSCEGE